MTQSKRRSGSARKRVARTKAGDPPGGAASYARMLAAYVQLTEKAGPVYDKLVAARRRRAEREKAEKQCGK